jgi:hypothetical protein
MSVPMEDKKLAAATSGDVERTATMEKHTTEERPEEGIIEEFVGASSLKGFFMKLTTAGVELRGLEPVPAEQRTHTKYYNILTLFGGSFISILP